MKWRLPSLGKMKTLEREREMVMKLWKLVLIDLDINYLLSSFHWLFTLLDYCGLFYELWMFKF